MFPLTYILIIALVSCMVHGMPIHHHPPPHATSIDCEQLYDQSELLAQGGLLRITGCAQLVISLKQLEGIGKGIYFS